MRGGSERAAASEAVFRAANELLDDRRSGADGQPSAYLCECGRESTVVEKTGGRAEVARERE